MKELPTVTLIAYDTVDANRTIPVLKHCQKHFKFADTVLVTDKEPEIEHKGIRVRRCENQGYEGAMSWEVNGIWTCAFTEHVLFVSHDGMIANPQFWKDEWLQYDMIGAPWPNCWKQVGARWGDNRVGNTGLCLRSRNYIQALRHAMPLYRGQAGDVFGCQIMHKAFVDMGIKYAPVNVAAAFAWEQNIEEGWASPASFGYHGYVAGKTRETYQAILA